MLLFYNTNRDATEPRDEFLASLATKLKKDIKSTNLPFRTDNKGGRFITLPGHYNQMIYATLGNLIKMYS